MSGSGNVSCKRVSVGLREITPPGYVLRHRTVGLIVCTESAFAHTHMSARGCGIMVGDKDGREKSLWDSSSNAGLDSAYALQAFQSTIVFAHSTRVCKSRALTFSLNVPRSTYSCL